MRLEKSKKGLTGTPGESRWERAKRILLYGKKARLVTFIARSMMILMFLVATALAQVQSHLLSEVRVIDTNLDMGSYNISANHINATIDVCIAGGGPCLTDLATAGGTFYNKTSAIYTANFGGYTAETGYLAGNKLCDNEFPGTHLCSFEEIARTIATKNLSLIPEWTGEAWIMTGPAKYSPAPIPANDCNGFTHGTPGSYLGNWWSFNQNTGGIGKTGHCGNTLSVGCCR